MERCCGGIWLGQVYSYYFFFLYFFVFLLVGEIIIIRFNNFFSFVSLSFSFLIFSLI